ncbi:MAG: glycosyltransferase family 1 protein [Sphingomicrobium sp.]
MDASRAPLLTPSADKPLLFDLTRLIWRRWIGRKPTGIDRACLAYLDHFAGRSMAVLQHPRLRHIFSLAASVRLFALLRDPPPNFRTRLVHLLVRHGFRSAAPASGLLYLNIGHTGLDAPGYANWVDATGVRPVYLVHDLIPISHPEYCRAGERERHSTRMRVMLETAAGIVTNSRATKGMLETFARHEGLTSPPLLASLLGTTPLALGNRPVVAPDRPTFVVLGTIEGRKNHLFLLNLWTRLVERLGDAAPRLLVIGQRGWEAEQVFDLLDRSDSLRGHVVEVRHCSDEQLAVHLCAARALLFPSLAEGFGLPLVEALSLGTPVIASDLAVFREIAGDIPLYLSPVDGLGWETSILDYARSDSDARTSQVERIAAYRPQGWDDHFRAVDAWLAALGHD